MTSVHVRIDNDTAGVASVQLLELYPPLESSSDLSYPIRVMPYGTWKGLLDVNDVHVDPSLLSDRPLVGHDARIQYIVAGREWERSTSSEPTEL